MPAGRARPLNAGAVPQSGFASLDLTLTPEPSGPVLVLSALAAVAALYGLRRLRT